MPAYNAGKYIGESIESILTQTYRDWELVVVDDESTDHTASVVKAYQKSDPRIKYFWQKNGKQGKTRNRAILESTGPYIAFMDADDTWLPDKLMSQVRLLESRQVDLVFGYAYLIENNCRTTKMTGRGHGLYRGKEAIDFFLYHDALVISTVLTTRKAIEKVNYFTEDLNIQYCEDWHIWLKLAFEGFSFYTDAKVVSCYRIHQESAAKTEKQEKLKFFFALLDLHSRYRTNVALKEEIARRAYQLVYHNTVLTRLMIQCIVKFMKDNGYLRLSGWIYQSLFLVNQKAFRKVFLFAHKKLEREVTN
jgi:glycosyltransferase involved in cell wall biosynthesis